MHRILLLLAIVSFTGHTLWSQQDLYDMKHIVEVRIQFKEANWHYILDSLKEKGLDERLVADVTVDGKKYPQSGIRYKGNSSYFNVRNAGGKKLPLNIKVDYINKGTKLPGGFVTLKLSNVFRDPSFLREVMSYEIAGKYLPAPKANFAKVFLNGEYLGFYNLSESVDDDFLEKFYGDEDGVFFKCDPSWHQANAGNCKPGHNSSLEYLGSDTVCYFPYYEIKSKHGWKELRDFTQALNQQPQALENTLQVNEALWMLAFDNVLVNLDSYMGRLCHNYYMYRDEHQVWHPIIWDLNLCMGGFRYADAGAPLSNQAMQEMSLFMHYKEDNTERPLVVKLLANDHYRKIYLAHVRTIVEENFSNGWYKERAAEIQQLINQHVADDPNKLYDLATYHKNFTETVRVENSSIIGITELMDQRATSILAHPLMQKTQPSIENVAHKVVKDNALITASCTDTESVLVYYAAGAFQPWKKAEMLPAEDDAGHWVAELPIQEVSRFYLVAENKYIAKLSPARAGMEF
ncbi:MAG: CotH kinase family protein [Saprospiraceae bacterium]